MSASKASNDNISGDKDVRAPNLTLMPGTSRTWCPTALGREQQRPSTSKMLLERACLSSNKYGSYLRGTPSSQWVAAQSICIGHCNSSRFTQSRSRGAPLLACLLAPLNQRPITNVWVLIDAVANLVDSVVSKITVPGWCGLWHFGMVHAWVGQKL